MITTALDQKTFLRLNPFEVRQYLKSTGWILAQTRRSNINLFTIERDGKWYEITLPLNREFRDYLDAMNNVVEQIAEVEQRQAVDVIATLTAPLADVVRFRRADPATEDGTIPFDEGFKLFENAKKALYIVACDLLQPAFYHKRLSMKLADTFIQQCSFGQTERGSYIATVVCPFIVLDNAIKLEQPSLFEENPSYEDSFTRRVTIRLMRSLERIFQAIENDHLDALYQGDFSKDVISGNLLETILDFNGPTHKAEIEISTQWASIAPQPNQVPQTVRFNSDYYAPLEYAVERIQNQNEPIARHGEFVGRISLLQAEPDIEQRTNGEVILNTFDLDGKVIKPRLIVSPEEFDLAIKAMKEGLNVRVRGVLKTQKRAKILEYTSLELLD